MYMYIHIHVNPPVQNIASSPVVCDGVCGSTNTSKTIIIYICVYTEVCAGACDKTCTSKTIIMYIYMYWYMKNNHDMCIHIRLLFCV